MFPSSARGGDAIFAGVSSTLSLRCRCGGVTGEVRGVAPATCNRAICYCRDCRAFAHFLEVDILDAHGGTDIVQVSPSQVRITGGSDRMRSMRLAPNGLLRWYADCCRTPLGNMVSAKVPYVGLPRVCLVDATDAIVGPAVGVHGRLAPGGVPPGAYSRAPVSMIVKAVKLMLRWWMGGKGKPSPYFDDEGNPRVRPEVLDAERRERLRTMDARVGSARSSHTGARE